MIQSATVAYAFFGLDRPALSDAQASRKEALSALVGASSRGRNVSAGKAGKTGQPAGKEELTPEQQREIQKLKQTDQEVRRHEQAHMAVGGSLIKGGPSYTYQMGPDKRRYAIGGEVSIDTSPGKTPEETIPKAQHIRATALAPADPSPQDRSVAAQANQMESEAQIELAQIEREEAALAREASLMEEEEKSADEASRSEGNEALSGIDARGGSGAGASGEIGFYQSAGQASLVGLQLDSYA
ncbi:MAG: hypothetical protein LBJ76_01450 [Candidatus Accumulibacter sp.]|jgi:hypothetical protein|nr:hypothetical protein [Accumulibacter sp.]